MKSLKEEFLEAFRTPNPPLVEMPRPNTNNRKLGKRDARGRIRQCVGYLQNGKKARFQIADNDTSPQEAMRRLTLIQTIYEKQCAKSGCSYWNGWTKKVADKIGNGEPVLDACIGRGPTHVAGVVDQLKAWGIPVTITDNQTYSQGITGLKEQIVAMVQHEVNQCMEASRQKRGATAESVMLPVDPLVLAETATLYQALNAYCDDIDATGKRDSNNKLTTNCRQRKNRTKYFKQHHADVPLWKLDLPALERIAAYWRNRPATKRADRCSKDHARDMLKEMWRFLRWLDLHPNYRWLMPRGGDNIKRTPITLPEDDNGEAFQTITKAAYSPEQLAVIAKFTDAFGQALIAVCVNCAFGQSEIGQWPASKFVLHKRHPHGEKIGIESDDGDSWIVGPRPKTGVYGEHLLWPQVANAVKPFLDGRSVLPITGRGTPWYKTHSENPQAKFTTWWRDLMDEVLKTHPDLPYLPFGSLRDLLPDVLRNKYSDDVASLALQHGKLGEDDLLKCYANHPYARLFIATRELEAHFKPFLDVLVEVQSD